ncbi:hypothetical protein JTB14_035295 [Gonioctena quinquepunctata]|nr:hypothetical protein JTB14_035295 [Gonioctena quinquepunctata]
MPIDTLFNRRGYRMEVRIHQGVCNNSPALKMDGAEASCLYSTVSGMCGIVSIYADDHEALTSRRGRGGERIEGLAVRPSGAAVGADLGGSSKYSSKALED